MATILNENGVKKVQAAVNSLPNPETKPSKTLAEDLKNQGDK